MNEHSVELARQQLLRQLHDSTHAPAGKLAHPRCPHCIAELDPGRVDSDGELRRRLGLI